MIPIPGHFSTENTFVEQGHLAAIKSLSGLKVYLALLYHRNRQTGEAYPSTDTLATETGLNRGNVSRAIRELQNQGLIEERAERSGRDKSRAWGFPIGCAGATSRKVPSVALAQPIIAPSVAPAQPVKGTPSVARAQPVVRFHRLRWRNQ